MANALEKVTFIGKLFSYVSSFNECIYGKKNGN
jgi:hypothetical protein